MRDDGIGPAILDELFARGSLDVDLLDLGTDIFKLSIFGEGYEEIVVLDSFRGGGEAGEVKVYSGEDMTRSLDARIRSAHLIGSIEAIELLKAVKPSLGRTLFHMVGIVSKDISTGEGLSPEAAMSVRKAADEVERIVRG
jgi:hydrogenase maturation protease